MESLYFPATVYRPTSPRTGLSGNGLLRMRNLILAGGEATGTETYLECYKGSLDLNETIPTLALTGTLTAAIDALTIVGTGTAFTTELRSGQQFWAQDDMFMVNAVIDDTHITVYRGPSVALSADTGHRMPVMYEMDRQRATQIQGNGHQFDKGNIIAIGEGTFRLNGATISASMVLADGTPALALYDQPSGLYTIVPLDFATPTVAPTLAADASGTVGMQAGNYSLRLVPSSTLTRGYGNPGPRANVSIAVDERIEVDVSAVPMDTAAGQDAWDVYATQFSQTTNVNEGPWWYVRTVPASEIVADIFYIEYLDAEINRQGLLDYDNDPPPKAGFIAVIEGNPIWISCFGKLSDTPGPALVPAKPQNLEAAPANWVVTSSPPQTLLGVVESQARLYVPTPASLQQGVWAPTGDPLIPPLSLRPYWHMGFANPYQLVFALGWLIGYPQGGPTKSIADAEDAKAQFFGGQVAEITRNWIGPHVLVQWDQQPMVNAICFFHVADSQNNDGYWTTRVLIWGLNQGDWIGDVVLSDPDRDMVVCGVASVDNQLYFLAGGRVDGSPTITIDTFAWNTPAGSEVDYYAAWQLNAGGITDQNKSVRTMRANGRFTEAKQQLYGFDSDTPESLADIEAGTNPLIEIDLGTTTSIETTPRVRFNIPSLFTFTNRIAGTYDGSGDADQINGAELEYITSGNRR